MMNRYWNCVIWNVHIYDRKSYVKEEFKNKANYFYVIWQFELLDKIGDMIT